MGDVMSGLKFALLLAGFVLALVLSCADLGRDNPYDPRSDKYDPSLLSSAVAEASSSSFEDVPSSSSSGSDESSSSEDASSSSAGDASSSSSVNTNCDEADKCGGICYDKNTQFCFNDTAPYDRCNGNSYNVTTRICCNNAIYTVSDYGCCANKPFLISKYGCQNNSVLTKCGETGLFNPAAQFCASDEKVYSFCGGKPYDPPSGQSCLDGVVSDDCGTGSINNSTQFCFDNTPYLLCGGQSYNPNSQFCYNNNEVSDMCGGKTYSTSQFCVGSTLYDKCGSTPSGATYNPNTQQCCGSLAFNTETQFCYSSSSKIGDFCGINPQKYYDPGEYECKEGKNGIYLKEGILYEGQTYNAVLIGSQVWMAENLNYAVTGSKCYNDSDANCKTYGMLYNWSTALALDASCNSTNCSASMQAKHKGICPEGWHLPSDAEWTTLTTTIGGINGGGTKLKATSVWIASTNAPTGTDDYGFSALPGGLVYDGNFYSDGLYGFWWSATESDDFNAHCRRLDYGYADVGSFPDNKSYFYSVRCVKN